MMYEKFIKMKLPFKAKKMFSMKERRLLMNEQ